MFYDILLRGILFSFFALICCNHITANMAKCQGKYTIPRSPIPSQLMVTEIGATITYCGISMTTPRNIILEKMFLKPSNGVFFQIKTWRSIHYYFGFAKCLAKAGYNIVHRLSHEHFKYIL